MTINFSQRNNFSWCFVFILAVLSVLPLTAKAQVLSLKAPKTTYQVGDSFQVSLVLDTGGRQINTLSGIIDVPTDKFQISDLRYGNSVVTLWVERPRIDYSKGIVVFTGGIPGGFGGSNGPILSFGLKARRAGSSTITLQEIKLLLNDGLGTELKNVALGSLSLTTVTPPPAKKSPPPAKEEAPKEPKEVYQPPPDTVPPEEFIPLISRHPSVAGNKYFVSFSAVDKDSGISHYEIREFPLLISRFTSRFDTTQVRAETPYILQGQLWAYRVIVLAYDQAGNVTAAKTVKPLHPWLILLLVFGGGMVIALLSAGMTYIAVMRPLKKKAGRFGKIGL